MTNSKKETNELMDMEDELHNEMKEEFRRRLETRLQKKLEEKQQMPDIQNLKKKE